jgi:hypothetical protein
MPIPESVIEECELETTTDVYAFSEPGKILAARFSAGESKSVEEDLAKAHLRDYYAKDSYSVKL